MTFPPEAVFKYLAKYNSKVYITFPIRRKELKTLRWVNFNVNKINKKKK